MNASEIAGLAGLALTIVALGLAIVQMRGARLQSRALTYVTQSLSTRYIGSWPDYLDQVTQLVNGASKYLVILNANPVPGLFSANDRFIVYSQAVVRKCTSDVLTTILCSDPPTLRKRMMSQFPTSQAEWNVWLPANKDRLNVFMARRYPEEVGRDWDHVSFLDRLVRAQERVLQEQFKFNGVQVIRFDQELPIQVWIADDTAAILSIGTDHKTAGGADAVFTSDPRFVASLRAMITRYVDRGESSASEAVGGGSGSRGT